MPPRDSVSPGHRVLDINRDKYVDHLVDVSAVRPRARQQLGGCAGHLSMAEERRVGEEGLVPGTSRGEAERRIQLAECGESPTGDPLKDGCNQGV